MNPDAQAGLEMMYYVFVVLPVVVIGFAMMVAFFKTAGRIKEMLTILKEINQKIPAAK